MISYRVKITYGSRRYACKLPLCDDSFESKQTQLSLPTRTTARLTGSTLVDVDVTVLSLETCVTVARVAGHRVGAAALDTWVVDALVEVLITSLTCVFDGGGVCVCASLARILAI